MAPRKPPASKSGARQPVANGLPAVQKYSFELQRRIAELDAAANSLQPPVTNNAAATIAFARLAEGFPGAVQSVLSAYFELLYAALPAVQAGETAKVSRGYFTDDIVRSLILTAQARVNPTPADPNYTPSLIDRMD